MSDDPRRKLTNLPTAYEVGYAKPPPDTRFQKGASGNPRGRPKGAKTKWPQRHEERLKGIILEEAYRTITLNEGNRRVTIPVAQAVMRSLAVNAARGQHRAQRLFSELLAATEAANRRLHEEHLELAMEYKMNWEEEIARCRAAGLPVPQPVPHPDDIVISMKDGSVTYKGPITTEQKAGWDKLWDRLESWDREIAWVMKQAKHAKSDSEKQILADDLAHARRMRAKIIAAVGERPKR